MATATPIPTSLSHLQWRATEWLLAFGPLSQTTVMDYFVMSPFFDRGCNNAVLRMQMMFSRGGMEGVQEEEELKRFVGMEYVVVTCTAPSLFVIHKRERTSPTEASTIAVYYILNDNVYQSPSLYSVLNERLLTSIHALSSSLELLKQHKPTWTPENLYDWKIRPTLSSVTEAPSQAPAHSPLVANPLSASSPLEENSISIADEGDAKKRTRNESNTVDEDEHLRPSSTFNPLLWQAIQSASLTLTSAPAAPELVPPAAAPIESVPPTPTPSLNLNEGIISQDVLMGEGGKSLTVAGKGAEGGEKGVRIGPTGKRKPKKAA